MAIKIVRILINRIVDSPALHRTQWHNMLPYISNCINKTHLTSAQGLTRTQLLFSPYVQASGLPAENLFFIQERIYKKILSNRQKIMLDRQTHIKTNNDRFRAGQLLVKLNKMFMASTFRKSMPIGERTLFSDLCTTQKEQA